MDKIKDFTGKQVGLGETSSSFSSSFSSDFSGRYTGDFSSDFPSRPLDAPLPNTARAGQRDAYDTSKKLVNDALLFEIVTEYKKGCERDGVEPHLEFDGVRELLESALSGKLDDKSTGNSVVRIFIEDAIEGGAL